MGAPPPLPVRGKVWPAILVGIIVANIVAATLFVPLANFVMAHKDTNAGTLAAPNLLLIPFVGGLAAAWCWRRLNRGVGASALDALWTSLLSIAAGALFKREGVICLIMASPALYGMYFAGMVAGCRWFTPRPGKLQLSIFPLLLLITTGDGSTSLTRRLLSPTKS